MAKDPVVKPNEQYICDRFTGKLDMPAATTTEIAVELGVTYQAVHRILKKHGLTRKDGGMAERDAEAGATAKGPVMCDKYGCTKEQWDELRAMDEDHKETPLGRFHTFKNNFQNLYPEVVFDLSLWEWWTTWKESGKWGQHKRNPNGMFVLVQRDKTLPLNKENIHIIPFGEYLGQTRKQTARKPKVVTEEPLEAECA
jgi:hypothetical protein